MFETLRPAVEHVLSTFDVEQSTDFSLFIQDELSAIRVDTHTLQIDKTSLHRLYELRSKYLDWELGTGYIGCFSKKAGTRYAFTRIAETAYQLCTPLKPDANVLEIGCGAGLLSFELARSVKTVVGIDISHFVLDFANRVKDYLHCDNVFFQQGDAEHLAFDNEIFDVVICSEVLEHLIEPQQALTEMRRILKKNGTLILTTPCAVSLSDLCMNLVRLIRPSIESEKDVHFDKKTYFALQREGKQHNTETFLRVHTRFHYKKLLTMIQNTGFEVQQAVGAVFAFPPHYQVFYRYCPAFLLPAIRAMEHLLNRLHVFQRVGAVTTCFRLTAR